MQRLSLILAAVLGLAAMTVPASANLQYTLNCKVEPCSGVNATNNFGTVTLATGAAGHVVVTVQLLATEKFANAGFALVWNILPSSNLTVALQGANSGNFSTQNSANAGNLYPASPFTKNANNCNGANAASCFDYAIGHTTGTDNSLVFDVTKIGGLALTDFVTNTLGFTFASNIQLTNNNDLRYVGSNADPVRVPEPGSLPLSVAGLAGLMGLVMLQRRRKLARAA